MTVPIISVDHIPNVIEPIGLTFDIHLARRAADEIYAKTGFNKFRDKDLPRSQFTHNLKYPKNIPKDLINKYGESVKFYGPLAVDEKQLFDKYQIKGNDFTEMDGMVSQSYLGEIYREIQVWHQEHRHSDGYLTRYQTTLLSQDSGYQLHVDSHCVIRYHMALSTNRYCYFFNEHEGQLKAVHIPSDGRVWILNTQNLHTAANMAPNSFSKEDRLRNHLILTVTPHHQIA